MPPLPPGAAATAAASAYPDIPSGSSASGCSPFHATAGGSLACGAPLSMSLTLATSQGRYRVPVSVTTGRAASPQSTNSVDVPKAIPDANATGINSSTTVSGTGTVATVDVSIARITHTWVGDLQIELIGPDGTRV